MGSVFIQQHWSNNLLSPHSFKMSPRGVLFWFISWLPILFHWFVRSEAVSHILVVDVLYYVFMSCIHIPHSLLFLFIVFQIDLVYFSIWNFESWCLQFQSAHLKWMSTVPLKLWWYGHLLSRFLSLSYSVLNGSYFLTRGNSKGYNFYYLLKIKLLVR